MKSMSDVKLKNLKQKPKAPWADRTGETLF